MLWPNLGFHFFLEYWKREVYDIIKTQWFGYKLGQVTFEKKRQSLRSKLHSAQGFASLRGLFRSAIIPYHRDRPLCSISLPLYFVHSFQFHFSLPLHHFLMFLEVFCVINNIYTLLFFILIYSVITWWTEAYNSS